MELNEVHNEHEHASVSMKALMLIFAVVLVAALGYLVWNQNNEPDTTDYTAPSVKNSETTETTTTEETATTTDETANWKTYTNAMFGFSLKYPSDWKISTSTIDGSTSPAQGFNGGRTYVQIYQGTEDSMTKKLELGFGSTEAASLDDQLKLIVAPDKYTETSRETFNDIVWSLGKVNMFGSETNMGATGHAWLKKSYAGVSNDKIHLFATGYHFTGNESSKLTDEMTKLLEQVLGTFAFTK